MIGGQHAYIAQSRHTLGQCQQAGSGNAVIIGNKNMHISTRQLDV